MHIQIHVLQSNEAACDTAIYQFIHAGDHPLDFWGVPCLRQLLLMQAWQASSTNHQSEILLEELY